MSLVPRPHLLMRKRVWWPLSTFLVVLNQQHWFWTSRSNTMSYPKTKIADSAQSRKHLIVTRPFSSCIQVSYRNMARRKTQKAVPDRNFVWRMGCTDSPCSGRHKKGPWHRLVVLCLLPLGSQHKPKHAKPSPPVDKIKMSQQQYGKSILNSTCSTKKYTLWNYPRIAHWLVSSMWEPGSKRRITLTLIQLKQHLSCIMHILRYILHRNYPKIWV